MSLQAQIGRIVKLSDAAQLKAAIKGIPDNIRELTGYVPRVLQETMARASKRFNVFVVHRRFGKSVMEVNKVIERAIDCPLPDGRYAYFAPTYKQAQGIAWVHLEAFTKHIPGCHAVKGKLELTLPTRLGSTAQINLYGLDNPKQRMRGLYLDGAVFDEFPWIPPSAWTQQVRPMLMDEERRVFDRNGNRNQWADFIGTPFGRNHFHTLYNNARLWGQGQGIKTRNPLTGEEEIIYSDDWTAALFKASETGILNAEELAAACIEMDMLPGNSKYLQEMECSFDAAVEGAIFAKVLEEVRKQGRICKVPWNKLLPVNTGWDLGYNDATAIWFFQQLGDEVRFIDYYENCGADLSHYADMLAERGYRYGYHLLPHDVEQSSVQTGKTSRTILEDLGVRVTTVPRYKPERDGIPVAQVLMARSLFDDEKCADGLDRLALYRREYDERNNVLRFKALHDWNSHGASAFMQCAMGIKKQLHGVRQQQMAEL